MGFIILYFYKLLKLQLKYVVSKNQFNCIFSGNT